VRHGVPTHASTFSDELPALQANSARSVVVARLLVLAGDVIAS
jgi:hypothetical protein